MDPDGDKEKDPPGASLQGSKSAAAGSKSARKTLYFERTDNYKETNAFDCLSLLRDMELDDEEELEEESEEMLTEEPVLLEEEEKSNLPDEWIYSLSEENRGKSSGLTDSTILEETGSLDYLGQTLREGANKLIFPGSSEVELSNSQTTTAETTVTDLTTAKGKEATGKKVNNWGPIIATRRSTRNSSNGVPVMDKAQEAKRKWNLDNNTGIKKILSQNLTYLMLPRKLA